MHCAARFAVAAVRGEALGATRQILVANALRSVDRRAVDDDDDDDDDDAILCI